MHINYHKINWMFGKSFAKKRKPTCFTVMQQWCIGKCLFMAIFFCSESAAHLVKKLLDTELNTNNNGNEIKRKTSPFQFTIIIKSV